MPELQSSRRRFLTQLGAGVATLTLSGSRKAAAAAERPNIIYILADDLGYGDLGCYGQTKIKTPHIDRLAAEGMRFTQHYAGSTVCAPSRCALMTGFHTGHARIRGNKLPEPSLLPEDVTVAELLKKAGYATGCVGKWGLGDAESTGIPTRQGFDFFFGYLNQVNPHFYYPPFLWRNEEQVFYPDNDPEARTGQYSHDLIAEEGLNFIRRNKDRPFFLYVPFTIPHAEMTVPEDSMAPYIGKFDEVPYKGGEFGAQAQPRAAFAGMVSRMDRDVGRTMDLLEELGLDDRTIVFFSSDNGPHWEGGHHPKYFDSNGPLRGIKRDLYEGGIRVPLIARWPGKIKAAAESDHLSAFWDVLPTLTDLAGLETPSGIDGISFLPALQGNAAQQLQHEHFYWEFSEWGNKQAIRWGDWKGVRLNLRRDPDAPVRLYNLAEDPGEANDVSAKHRSIARKLRELMEAEHTPSSQFPLTRSEYEKTP